MRVRRGQRSERSWSRALGSVALLATLGGAATPALAAEGEVVDGLEWQWTQGQERTYHIAGQILLPRFIFFNAFNNIDARISEARMELVLGCVGHEQFKRGWEVHCTIDDISLQAVALPADKGRLDKVTAEWDERLTGKTLELELLDDGRVRNVGFGDLTRRNCRDGENMERVRQLMARMLSPLDLRLPKKGTDKGKGGWSQKDAQLTMFPSLTGSVGAVQITHQIAGKKGSKVKLTSGGKGTVGHSETARDVAGQESIDYYALEVVSEAMFDLERGELISRQVLVSGSPTASASIADGTAGLPYVQAYRVTLVSEGDAPPTLPESKEIEAAFPEAE